MTSLLRSLASKAGFSNGRIWQPETGLADLTGKVSLQAPPRSNRAYTVSPRLQVAAVTGANEGIGFITARELHKKGCKVFLLCRNQEKAQDAIKRINEASPGQPDNLVFVSFDLTDIPSAKKAAEAISNQVSRLDILVNNAGIMAWPYELKNGIEVQFVRSIVTSAGPTLESKLAETGDSNLFAVEPHWPLCSHQAPAPAPRQDLEATWLECPHRHCLLDGCVFSSSCSGAATDPARAPAAHKFSPKPDFSSLEAVNREMRSTWERYGQSKLVRPFLLPRARAESGSRSLWSLVPRMKANILFSIALQDRLKDEKIYVRPVDGISPRSLVDACVFRSTLFTRATSTQHSLADRRLLTVVSW